MSVEENKIQNFMAQTEDVNPTDEMKKFEEYLNIYKDHKNIQYYKDFKPRLTEYGINNTQIFTREEEILKMIDSIGRDKVIDVETTILEPTSGDGAFTVRILDMRLEKLIRRPMEEYIVESLKAISTIYSIEYELPSLIIQRDNLMTVLMKHMRRKLKANKENLEFFKEKDIGKKWNYLSRKIIQNNIIWGSTATDMDIEYRRSDSKLVGFYRIDDTPINIIK